MLMNKKYLPKDILHKCIQTYEKNDLFLKKTPYYYNEKKKLYESKTSCEDFKQFINSTRGNKFTSFNTLPSKNIKSIICAKENIVYDIFFDKCLYVKPNFWYKNCFTNFHKVVSENSALPFLIIDLRDSNGGYIKHCIDICNIFLHNCEIVKLVYKNKTISYYADENELKFKKIFIIVNRNTMSSAEILAYSLKANLEEAVILGEDTFNKNFGQIQFVNEKYKYIFSIPTFFWLVSGNYDKKIIYLSNEKIINYILSHYYVMHIS